MQVGWVPCSASKGRDEGVSRGPWALQTHTVVSRIQFLEVVVLVFWLLFAWDHSRQLEALLDPVFGPSLMTLPHLGGQQNIADTFKGLT